MTDAEKAHILRLHLIHTATLAKKTIQKSNRVGCFYCQKVFYGKEITQWTTDGCAICPLCGVDAVLPENYLFPLNKELLQVMHDYWFSDNQLDDLDIALKDEKLGI